MTPLEWLWKELERRFGPEVAHEIYVLYLEQQRRYQQDRRDTRRKRREEARA